jgi:probable phosphoglycerate mutase
MGMLFVVRHGESGWNRAHLTQGQSPAAPGLTMAGRRHAAAVAGRLAGSGATLVLASDLRRAVQTAAPVAARLAVPVRIEPRLRERGFGVAEGQPADRARPAELGVTSGVVTDPDAAPAGGESIRQLYERVAGLLEDLLASTPDSRIVLVTHGGVVRVIQALVAGLGPAGMPWPPVGNGSVLEIPVPESARAAAGGSHGYSQSIL